MLAIDEDAIAWRICGFSLSRLKVFGLPLLFFLSFLACFVEEVSKLVLVGEGEEIEPNLERFGEVTAGFELSASSLLNGSSFGLGSVSFSTLD